MDPARKVVMISSTARDLPEHRKAAMEACRRQGFFPVWMEDLPASDADAVAESMRMVDEADIYLGILGFGYGTTPAGHDKSYTEMEYDQAAKKTLMFVMSDQHPLLPKDVETGEGAKKLQAFIMTLKRATASSAPACGTTSSAQSPKSARRGSCSPP